MDVEGPAAEIFIVAQVGKRQCPHTKAEAEAIRCVGRWGRLERRRLLRNHFKDGILRRNLRECLQPRTSRNREISLHGQACTESNTVGGSPAFPDHLTP
ncbi:MAG: hypothetical protein DMG16_01235 [Acidobacteria bacterium]|nr:MAG: hypothetical protein DMG16_01235 [Acidobacteriota bacterium]